MQKPEFRVRPVIRHVVTRFTPQPPPPEGSGYFSGCANGGVETLGEFDSEGYADIVAEALRERVAPRTYVIVQETLGEEVAIVQYGYDEAEALSRKRTLEERTGKSFGIYSRLKPPLDT